MSEIDIERVLFFWFGELGGEFDFPMEKAQAWFESTAEFNDQIQKEFGALHAAAQAGELDSWQSTPRGCLALVILLDQFTRNLHNDGLAFASDAKALQISEDAIQKGLDKKLKRVERAFMYLPYEHSEDLQIQEKSVALFKGLCDNVPASQELPFLNMLDYAKQHHEVIKRFGRFPHRNKALNRKPTPSEQEYLVAESQAWEN